MENIWINLKRNIWECMEVRIDLKERFERVLGLVL
jgi:hypothetical protein